MFHLDGDGELGLNEMIDTVKNIFKMQLVGATTLNAIIITVNKIDSKNWQNLYIPGYHCDSCGKTFSAPLKQASEVCVPGSVTNYRVPTMLQYQI